MFDYRLVFPNNLVFSSYSFSEFGEKAKQYIIADWMDTDKKGTIQRRPISNWEEYTPQ